MVYTAALIGCGKIGSEFCDDPLVTDIYTHSEAYAACPETILTAVCDIDPDKVRRCGERWKVPARYCDAAQMLAEQQPQIVSICTPDSSHSELILLALATPSVQAILTEKPLALDLRQAQNIVRLVSEWNGILAVNYSRRYIESYNRLRGSLQSGLIGQIQNLSGYFTKGTIHNGTHWFDLARFLLG